MKFFPHICLCLCLFSIPFSNFAYNGNPTPTPENPPRKIKLKRGTKITLQLNTTVNSNEVSTNTVIEMMVVLDVKAKGENQSIILAGTYAEGIVTSARRAGIFGKGAKIELEGINIRAIDGQRIPIKSLKVSRRGKNRKRFAYGASILIPTVGIIMGTPILLPFAIIGVFVKGRNVEISVGTLVTAKILEDVEIYL